MYCSSSPQRTYDPGHRFLGQDHPILGQLSEATGQTNLTIQTGAPLVTLDGHADFVKSVTILPGPALLSTSSDRTIRLWDLRPLVVEQTPAHIQTLRQHTRPVDCTAWRQDSHAIGIHVWTGDSLGVIKQWTFDAEAVDLKFEHDIAGHQTSISQLRTCTSGLWSCKSCFVRH